MFDVSCWNWTGPKVNPKTKQLFRLETNELVKAMANRTAIQDQLAFGDDEYGSYMEFIADSGLADSGTTENTHYPRSELRQTLKNGDDKEANWTPKTKPQSMRSRLRIMSLAESLKAILGQIHGDGDHPPLKIQVTGDMVYAQLRQTLDGKEYKPALGKVKLGVPFTYRVDMFDDYTADIYFNEVLIVERYQFDAKSYAKDTWYWKAGVYSQDDAKAGKGRGCVRFYDIVVADNTPVPATPAQPAARTLKDLSADVAKNLSDFQSGKVGADQALAAIQALKVEADTDFEKGTERSSIYDQVTTARAAIRAPAKPSVPVEPTPTLTPTPAPVLNLNEALKAKLSAMEDTVDSLPDDSAKTLRTLIADMRKLIENN